MKARPPDAVEKYRCAGRQFGVWSSSRECCSVSSGTKRLRKCSPALLTLVAAAKRKNSYPANVDDCIKNNSNRRLENERNKNHRI